MPKVIINVADILNAKTGKTYRQENSELIHKIPLWSLVEILPYYDGDGQDYNEHSGIRAFVCEHARDCDQTPLYSVTILTKADYERTIRLAKGSVWEDQGGNRWNGEFFMRPDTVNGLSDDNLLVIRFPKE